MKMMNSKDLNDCFCFSLSLSSIHNIKGINIIWEMRTEKYKKEMVENLCFFHLPRSKNDVVSSIEALDGDIHESLRLPSKAITGGGGG